LRNDLRPHGIEGMSGRRVLNELISTFEAYQNQEGEEINKRESNSRSKVRVELCDRDLWGKGEEERRNWQGLATKPGLVFPGEKTDGVDSSSSPSSVPGGWRNLPPPLMKEKGRELKGEEKQ